MAEKESVNQRQMNKTYPIWRTETKKFAENKQETQRPLWQH